MLILKSILIFFIFINLLSAKNSGRYWIYFKDKASNQNLKFSKISDIPINQRALQRRQLRAPDMVFHPTDLPISQAYIDQLKDNGIKIYRQSRWLNAVSVYLNDFKESDLEKFSFIKKVEPVRSYGYSKVESPKPAPFYKTDGGDYGPSLNQNEMIGIPYAHDMGYHGEGVLIAVFDMGFILEHEALQHIQVTAAWDFINDDAIVANEEGDHPFQHNHGTEVLATLAGYKPGQIIGPAYASQFILAKTEDIAPDTHIEEDNWIAAAEWAESLGADVISSSVGYILDYTYEDLDGNTTAITRAADIAVSKGVSVFNGAGNEGLTSWKYIIAPADGDSVIAIGGVREDGTYWSVSSRGPTYDGRIKPDLMAQARNVYTVNPRTIDSYALLNGISYSCPLGAGAGAILLSLNPSLTTGELKDALIQNATRFNNPDNFFGYGLIDLEKSIKSIAGVNVTGLNIATMEGRNSIEWIAEKEVANEKWTISRKNGTLNYVKIGEIDGRKKGFSPLSYSFLDFDIIGGETFVYQLSAQLQSGQSVIVDSIQTQSLEPKETILLNNFPNPFNSETRIIFGLNIPQTVSLKIFDIRGHLVKTLVDNKKLEAQYHHFSWNGKNNSDQIVSSGNYYIQLIFDGSSLFKKVVFLK